LSTPIDSATARAASLPESNCIAPPPRRKGYAERFDVSFPHPGGEIGILFARRGAMDSLIDLVVVLAPAAVGLMCLAVASLAQMRRH